MLKYLLRMRPTPWFVTMHKGAALLLNAGEKTDRFVYLRNNEDIQIERMSDWVRRHRVIGFLDIGANFGLYSVILGRRYPGMRVHAFEPVERVRSQLQANVLINSLENLDIHAVAASDVSAQASYLQHVGGHAGLSKLRQIEDAAGIDWVEMTVETQPLDQLLDYRGERLAIKVDVEGHECEVIRGMHDLLRNNVCYVQIEICPRRPKNREFIFQTMARLGYELDDIFGKDHIFISQKQSA